MDDKELDRILNVPEPRVIVNRDGSCTPVAMNEKKVRELLREGLNDIRAIAVKIQPSAIIECSRLYNICNIIEKRVEAALAESGAGQAFPDWICNHCGQRIAGGLGKPTICPNCGWNNWRQDDQPAKEKEVLMPGERGRGGQ